MTNEEAIELIKVAQAEVEWHCPMDYAAAFDLAIKALEQQPCEDCISRQAVLVGLASIAKIKAKSDAQKSLMGRVMFFTEHLPSVTPQPKTGHWMDRFPAKECKCSVCDFLICISNGSYIDMVGQMKYCPNCGAKMKSEDEE